VRGGPTEMKRKKGHTEIFPKGGRQFEIKKTRKEPKLARILDNGNNNNNYYYYYYNIIININYYYYYYYYYYCSYYYSYYNENNENNNNNENNITRWERQSTKPESHTN
jgi:hypothetical protein